MNKLKDKYIVGEVNEDGRLIPIGWSKDFDYAVETAKKHKCKVYELNYVEVGWRLK